MAENNYVQIENNIIRGVKVEYDNDQSYGEIVFYKLRDRKSDVECLIDYATKSSITLKQIFEESKKVAVALKAYGIQHGDVISLLAENSLNYFATVLASFYVGAIINPLNPDYTIRELSNCFTITSPKLVITNARNLEMLMNNNIKREMLISIEENAFDIETYANFINVDATDFIPDRMDDQDGIVILCSSGTTGLPKAVLLTHYNLKYGSLHLRPDAYLNFFSESDVSVGLLPFFHVFGFLLVLAVINIGGKLVLLKKFKPTIYLEIIQDYKVNRLYLVPPLALFLAKSPLVDNYDLSHVMDVTCGAAPLGHEIQTILEEKFKTTVRQLYGLTESTGMLVAVPFGAKARNGTAGVPVTNVECKIVDLVTNAALGPHQEGEVCVRTPTIMKAYYNNAEATKATFDDEGWYHTGDIAYYEPDGYIFIVDRLKELIKFKGFQVPPAELEDILIKHPLITDAGVIGIPDEKAGEVPLAFIVKADGAEISEKEIVDYVAEHVSVQKQLRGGVRFIDAIPKSVSGKILRRELRAIVKNLN